MSLIINIPDLDDSASQLAVLQETIAGFPVTNLQALYLFEDGDVGSTPTQAVDSSGNGRHASLLAGSSITRIDEGVKTGDALNNGFMLNTGVAYNASFSAVGVIRCRIPVSTSGAYPLLHGISAAYGVNGVGASYGGATTYGVFNINHDATGATDAINLAPFNGTPASAKWPGAPSNRPSTTNVSPRATWEAWGLSVDVAAGTIVFRANGSTITFTSKSDLDLFMSQGGNHIFGYSRYLTGSTALGDVGLFGLYSGANDVAGLDVLIAAAKTRMSDRGVTAA